MLFVSDYFSVAPRYQKSQGCRAPKEGQVNVQSLLRPFSLRTCAYVIVHSYATTLLLILMAHSTIRIIWGIISWVSEEQNLMPRNPFSCGWHLGLLDTLLLIPTSTQKSGKISGRQNGRTFLKVLRPAKIDPPIQVEYFRSGGAYIFIFKSFSANFFTSFKRRSPKPISPFARNLISKWCAYLCRVYSHH